MFCEKCGRELPENIMYCPDCGQKIYSVNKENVGAEKQEPAVSQNEPVVSEEQDSMDMLSPPKLLHGAYTEDDRKCIKRYIIMMVLGLAGVIVSLAVIYQSRMEK